MKKTLLILTAMTLSASFAMACGASTGGRLGDSSSLVLKPSTTGGATTRTGSGNAEIKK